MVCMSSNAAGAARHPDRRAHRRPARVDVVRGVRRDAARDSPTASSARDAEALQQNIRLAESLGATVVRVKADEPADGLIAFAQREGVTHVIFGQSARSRWELLWRGLDARPVPRAVPDAAVQVVPQGR